MGGRRTRVASWSTCLSGCQCSYTPKNPVWSPVAGSSTQFRFVLLLGPLLFPAHPSSTSITLTPITFASLCITTRGCCPGTGTGGLCTPRTQTVGALAAVAATPTSTAACSSFAAYTTAGTVTSRRPGFSVFIFTTFLIRCTFLFFFFNLFCFQGGTRLPGRCRVDRAEEEDCGDSVD